MWPNVPKSLEPSPCSMDNRALARDLYASGDVGQFRKRKKDVLLRKYEGQPSQVWDWRVQPYSGPAVAFTWKELKILSDPSSSCCTLQGYFWTAKLLL